MKKVKQQLPRWINLMAGGILCLAHLFPFMDPIGFFHELYQVEFPTPQSITVVRTLSGVLASVGFLWILAALRMTNQKPLLKATLVLTLSFVGGRVYGLLVDGFNQKITYYEFGFEVVALIVILGVLSFLKKENEGNA